jgi:hypothetical protein
LKLHHLFPKLGIFHTYHANDLDPTKEQDVDQVMGACFLVRRLAWEEIGGFDERYFIWMEEVDLCKSAKEKGWHVLYVPSVTVTHHLGRSFAQELQLAKQRYFTTSLVAYFDKWHRGWRSIWMRMIAPIGVGLVWAMDMLRNPYVFWSVFAVVLEAVSAATIFSPIPNTILCLYLGAVAFIAGWKRPSWGLSLLALELLIGSMGYLLQAGAWPHTISLRIVLTACFFIGWAYGARTRIRMSTFIQLFEGRSTYLTLIFLMIYAYFRGILIGNASVLQDANAWADWLLLFPILDIAAQHADRIRKDLVPPLVVGVVWLGIKALGLEYLFAHRLWFANDAYLWVRRTGVGEVTNISGDMFRIFMQSQVYAVSAWLFSFSWWIFRKDESSSHLVKKSTSKKVWGMLVICVVSLGISLSRSFWIGAFVGAVCVCVIAVRRHMLTWGKSYGIAMAKVVGLASIIAVLLFPVPHIPDVHLLDLFGSRANVEEPAAMSRMRLLPILWQKIQEHPILGSGFGAAVTYKTSDPRILQDHPDGMYTTYAFEWGWLEHWIKLGILGIPVMLYAIWSLGKRIWRLQEPEWLRIGAVASLCALVAIHIFTPYLNHPLGFLFFFLGEGFILSSQRKNV